MIIGNLGKDPEMKYTQQGTPITSFSVAVSRTWKGPDGTAQEETEWFRVVAWERLAEQCNEFLRKGRKVFIEGRLKTREWTGQDGQKRFTTEVVATSMILLDPKQGGGDYSGGGGGFREERQAPARQGAGAGATAGAGGGGAAGGFGHSYDDEADLDVDDIPF
jgi:single-strand DNA-binding protein